MNKWGPAVRFIGVGFYIVACIFGGVLGGYWLDKTFNTKPILLLVGLILGLVAAFWGVYQMLVPIMKESNKTDKKDRR
jgi:ATP synthase protein I